MYRRILVPLDGSKTAEKVLPYVRSLAGSLKIAVELIGVIDIAELAIHISADNARHIDHVIEDSARRSEEYLKGVASTFAGASVRCTAEKGRAEEVIIEKAKVVSGTLIAMATHGRSGISRWLLGSIAEKVVRGANNPVFLVRANEEIKAEGETTPNSIIVPLDGSELAESILPSVVELAKANKLKVILLRSYSVRQVLHSYEDYIPDLNELEAKSKSAASSYLDSKVQQLKREGLVDVLSVVLEGGAAEIIIELAKGSPNSLIAMCTHGRSGIRRWVLGSVTEKVFRHSGNPVLVIRAT